jgi:CRISPR-associated protein (TIGR03984 family)
VLLWRNDSAFQGRRVIDGEKLPKDAWQEQHLLWGSRVAGNEDFTVLEEGSQGPVHAVPLDLPGRQRAALTVRHYAQCNEHGQAAVVLSRLVDLGPYKPGKGS